MQLSAVRLFEIVINRFRLINNRSHRNAMDTVLAYQM